MQKTLLVILALLVLIISTISGCIWAIEDDGFRRGGYHDHDRGRGNEHGGRR